jgi:putative Mg2+ transporter-C (MgtC) family protein
MNYTSFDLELFGRLVIPVAVAFALAFPIGWERERRTRSAGLRTFPLVAIASCGYTMLAAQVIGAAEDAQSRVLQGLMTGIGFVGGGAILKRENLVRGTATAAGIWTTGAIGAAAGYGRYEVALLLSLVTMFTLGVLTKVEERIDRGIDPQAAKADPDE